MLSLVATCATKVLLFFLLLFSFVPARYQLTQEVRGLAFGLIILESNLSQPAVDHIFHTLIRENISEKESKKFRWYHNIFTPSSSSSSSSSSPSGANLGVVHVSGERRLNMVGLGDSGVGMTCTIIQFTRAMFFEVFYNFM